MNGSRQDVARHHCWKKGVPETAPIMELRSCKELLACCA